MAKRNGGIIGPSNVPTGQYGGTASGVWRLRDAFNYIKAGLWPGFATYPVANSLRFNSDSSDYLNRTPSTTGSTITTHSLWFKRSKLNSSDFLYINYQSGVLYAYIGFDGDKLDVRSSDSNSWAFVTTQLLRDVSAWYHLVVAVDTSNATAGDRVKIYLNGSRITAFDTATNPSSSGVNNLGIDNTTANLMNVGGYSGGNYFNGYISEFYFIDGQALTPTSFGQTDSATGIWTPLPYTGTYGTNGFYLKFANSAALGTDSSGNANTFTANNLTSVDQSTDTCTNNFSTLNNLAGSSQAAASTFSEGNLKIVAAGSNYRPTPSTIGVSAGKWYAEFLLNAAAGDAGFGIMGNQGTADGNWGGNLLNNYWWYCGTNAGTPGVYSNNSLITNGGIGTMTTNDIGMIAMDLDNNRVYFGKNGTFLNSSNPANGTNPYPITAATSTELGFYFFTAGDWGGGTRGNWSTNFGSPPFTIASGNADANGYGNFEYAVPAGYYSLNTKNLATYG